MTDMSDMTTQLAAIHREVHRRPADGGELVAVLLRERYAAPAAQVWDALTDPERIRRWFLPVGGELRPGGRFQFEGNAGGEVLACESPRLLRVTFGDASSVLELRLTALDGGETTVELEHTVPVAMAGSGAGALYVGPGWDLALFALGRYLAGDVADDPVAAGASPEGVELGRQSVEAWVAVVGVSGTATADEVAAGREAALAQFATPATT